MRIVVLTIALAIGTTPSLAQKTQAPNTSTGDPNERICEKVPMIGSRLASKRICATRAEWAERKQQDKEALEAAQKGPCIHKAGCP
ncbi:MAG: hypothetical protein HOP96_12220 [Sphingomonas sp.]|nr:hypothetical protein [Sphingomonas sp.]